MPHKHAVEGYSESLDHELRTRGIGSRSSARLHEDRSSTRTSGPRSKLDEYREVRALLTRCSRGDGTADEPTVVADVVLEAAIADRQNSATRRRARECLRCFTDCARRIGGRWHSKNYARRTDGVAASHPGLEKRTIL